MNIKSKANPFIEIPEVILQPGEIMAPLNIYMSKSYTIYPVYYITTFGRMFSIATGKLEEKQFRLNADGYYDVGVTTTYGKKIIIVHRAVLSTFNPRPDMYDLAAKFVTPDHTNIHLDNLRWADHPDVIYQPKPVEPKVNSRRYLTQEDYDKIDQLYRSGMKPGQIAKELGISDSSVYDLIIKWYGHSYERRDLNNLKKRQEIKLEPQIKKTNLTVPVPQELIDKGMQFVNPNISPLHVIEPFYGVTKDGKIYTMARGEWRQLECNVIEKGYTAVHLMTDKGQKTFRLHRIILGTFNPRPDMYDLDIDHINGIKTDNKLENLDWVTKKENNQRAAATGLTAHKTPQRAPDSDIIEINRLAWAGYTDEEISHIMNDKYSPYNVEIIRAGHKTYGPVLEQLGLKPYLRKHTTFSEEDRYNIYLFVESLLDSGRNYTIAYSEASKKYGASAGTIQGIYNKIKLNK